MKIAVTGPHGNLGAELVRQGCVPLDCDVTSLEQVRSSIQSAHPDVVINCAAKSLVDYCERNQKIAFAVNARGAGNVRWGFSGRLIHISTGYIFDGTKGPYDERHKGVHPVQEYGWSKLAGEAAVMADDMNTVVVRTMGLFGGHKPDFVTFVLDSLLDGMEVEAASRVSFNPTYVPHLAEALIYLAGMDKPPKVVNLVGREVLSRYEFALMIAQVFSLNQSLVIPSEGVQSWLACRPENAGLKTDLALRNRIPIYSSMAGLEKMRERVVERQ